MAGLFVCALLWPWYVFPAFSYVWASMKTSTSWSSVHSLYLALAGESQDWAGENVHEQCRTPAVEAKPLTPLSMHITQLSQKHASSNTRLFPWTRERTWSLVKTELNISTGYTKTLDSSADRGLNFLTCKMGMMKKSNGFCRIKREGRLRIYTYFSSHKTPWHVQTYEERYLCGRMATNVVLISPLPFW